MNVKADVTRYMDCMQKDADVLACVTCTLGIHEQTCSLIRLITKQVLTDERGTSRHYDYIRYRFATAQVPHIDYPKKLDCYVTQNVLRNRLYTTYVQLFHIACLYVCTYVCTVADMHGDIGYATP